MHSERADALLGDPGSTKARKAKASPADAAPGRKPSAYAIPVRFSLISIRKFKKRVEIRGVSVTRPPHKALRHPRQARQGLMERRG